LDINRTEQEQIETLKQWWSDNGKSVISGILLGLIAIFGWRGWQAHIQATAEAASDLYINMVMDMRQEKNASAREHAGKLQKEYPSTSYATFASLMLAKLEVLDGKTDAAVAHLQSVIDKARQDELKHLARLRMARILLDKNKLDEAMAALEVGDPGQFTASYSELKGDILTRQGKYDEARMAYQQVLGNIGEATTDTSFLQMKIDDLGAQNKE
jgi:Uncharacterized protein conserved in bacteria